MPELPEVETIVNNLNKSAIIGAEIKDVWTDWPKYFKLHGGEAVFKKTIVGRKIKSVTRRAKFLLFHLSGGFVMLVHQKMSGHFLIGKWRENNGRKSDFHPLSDHWQSQKWTPDPFKGVLADPENRFIRVMFFLHKGNNDLMLAFSDLRRFAKILCGPEEKILNLPELKELGPELLDSKFTFTTFKNLFEKKRGKIKQVLMDQKFISGIGNIYADEILWLAKIHPLREVNKLTAKELKVIYDSIKTILQKAIKLQGSSVDDYRMPNGESGKYAQNRYVYQREDEPCPRCKTPIKRIKIASRSAHFCPKCQKA